MMMGRNSSEGLGQGKSISIPCLLGEVPKVDNTSDTVFPDWTADKTQEWWKESFDHYRETAAYDGIWLGELLCSIDRV